MSRARRVAGKLAPWLLAAVQAWLLDRLLRQRGQVLLKQERVEADIVRLESLVRDAAGRVDQDGPAPAAGAASDATASSMEFFRAHEIARYQRLQDEARASTPPYPAGRFSGAGIVIVAGGPVHFTNVWVCLTMLRRVLGCRLPIQVWYLGPHEMSQTMIDLLGRFDVECIDASEVQRRHPMYIAGGWECKPYALVHSPFKEVILLDADNVPLVDPTALLAWPEYHATGAVFWPDLGSLRREDAIWDVCRIPYRDEPEVESGQIVIDKERCWDALHLTLHFNEHSDYYYCYVNGDKETFHMAWRVLGQAYSMPPKRPRWVTGMVSPGDPAFADILLQHDFTGHEIFHHRTGANWTAWGTNLHVPGFAYESACLDALAELRSLWDGRVDLESAPAAAPTPEAELLRVRHYLFRVRGSDERVLTLLPGGRIGDGRSRQEQRWRIEHGPDGRHLVLAGRSGASCQLGRHPDGIWRGRRLHQDRSPVELAPIAGVTAGARVPGGGLLC